MRRKPKKLPQMNTDQPRWKSKNFICTDQGKSAAHWFYFMFSVACPERLSRAKESNGCPLWLRIQFIWRLREALAVAFFNASHSCEQMGIGSCAEAFRLPTEQLHHQRIENAGFR